jgi:8-oxo-dGTP pyrophosphatase MutT (NUDIX family)
VTAAFTKLGEVELVRSKVFRVVQATFADEAGAEFDRTIVRHPGAVAVVPLHDDGTVSLVRQYRAALECDLLELPAGIRDVPGEAEQLTAERELVEEAGLAAGRMAHLTTFHSAPGMTNETITVFLATDLREVPHDRQSVEEHAMTVERLHLDRLLEMVADGRLTDAKTIIGLTLAVRRTA